jgi:hypothetical protein
MKKLIIGLATIFSLGMAEAQTPPDSINPIYDYLFDKGDHLLLHSRKSVGVADGFLYPHPVFEVKLPLKMKTRAYYGSVYWFVYDRDQIIFIINDEERERSLKADREYIPTVDDLFFVMLRYYSAQQIWGHISYERKERKIIKFEEAKLNPRRKYYVVVKDGFEIVFFNIKRRNFDRFYNLVVNSITVVDDKKDL